MNKTFKKITTVIIFIFIICCQFTSVFAIDEEKSNFQTHTAYDGIIVKNTKVLQPDFSDKINAKSYCLIELKTGRIITAKNENDHLPVASTTKIMTSYLTAKSTYLDQYFTVDDNAVIVEGTSMGLKPGYQVSLRGLLVGMLLKSGNDGANAAAVKVGSTNENFIKMMNDTAIKIGMKNTKFTTASGLDYGNPYSTAYDMALLTRVAINQPEVAEICSQTSLKTMVGNPLINVKYTGHNRILTEYDGGIGVKTGYTIKSGKCLVSAAK
ncbi:MAG: D-alanyl-D-alanine carboxypeptidase, partial [Oscillospiraceae bacterium]